MSEKLTREDIKKIEEEIEHRKLVVRPEAIDAVKEARAQGDLSENFEYYAAKRDKNKNESRINYLERVLRTATVIEDTVGEGEVGLEKRVELLFVEEGEREVYKIVTPIRADSIAGRISIDSPLGHALIGHKVGDTVPVGDYHVQILSVTRDDGQEEINSF